MANLFSKVRPIPDMEGAITVADAIESAMAAADTVEIAVGYVSIASLTRLNELVKLNHIQHIRLVIGMYKIMGIPEGIYNRAVEIHDGWMKEKQGSIFFVNNMNYHGKLFVFLKNGVPFQAIVGSANLSVLAPEGQTLRQYEVATTLTDVATCKELLKHIDSVVRTSANVATVDGLQGFDIIHERIDVLSDVENVMDITVSETKWYTEKETDLEFRIPIKAPHFSERFSNLRSAHAKSNINVAYGKGREARISGRTDRRDWYETQITVDKDITSLPGYPKGDPFYVVTDDGYKFLAHSTAQNDKQLTAYGNEGNDRVFGRWIKGRLATAGLVKPYDDVADDTHGDGIVTIEMLKRAHMQIMVLTKTDTQEFGRVFKRRPPTPRNRKGALDKKHFDDKLLDVWTIHFDDAKEGENE